MGADRSILITRDWKKKRRKCMVRMDLDGDHP
jgi:hypothetical protein